MQLGTISARMPFFHEKRYARSDNPPVDAIRSKYFQMFRGKGDSVDKQGQGDEEPELEAQARLD